MKRLLDILPGILETAPDSPELRGAVVFAAWRTAAGPRVAGNAAAVGLEGKTLTVAVREDGWKRELGRLGPQLLAKVNGLLGRKVLDKIVFVVDESALREVAYGPQNPNAAEPIAHPPKEVAEAANGIVDERLREAFLGAAAGSLAYREKYGYKKGSTAGTS